MIEGGAEVVLGNGLTSCTKVLKFFVGKLRGTNQFVVFIDTPGLDDSGGKKIDEQNLKNLFEQLR